ncbi:hypothetical protein R69749_08184 [Paraburkholderia domus]|uniref:Uncharacterized protein n=1 Tax=Paraburkholderia domus TaxID=2793075 RepID=A0A9N8NGE2_9BURK|nr:hypothetical protein R70006_08160 [Paraburkholderia domus]CAE6901683.1 hypothetical protein R69749_08184 [Paraburkholderia domus]CAE6968662.1 hypothetical protein R70211_07619 [Paraburkholderia domus]CAE6969806.1 hypothetical protein R70199_08113 [Paraburkholderia domus]
MAPAGLCGSTVKVASMYDRMPALRRSAGSVGVSTRRPPGRSSSQRREAEPLAHLT